MTTYTEIRCDGCSTTLRARTGEAEARAATDGWAMDGEEDFCPDCSALHGTRRADRRRARARTQWSGA